MLIGERLRAIREAKKLSQGDVERRCGLFRCYTSRVENGDTVPSLETLEKFARALEVPIYQMVYDGEKPPKSPDSDPTEAGDGGVSNRELRDWKKLLRAWRRMSEFQRELLVHVAQQMARRQVRSAAPSKR